MARVVALAPDLFFASKIEATLSAAGHEVTVATGPPFPGDAQLVIADLDSVEPAAALAPGLPVLGFYSHVDVETKRRADDAGLDLVVPRSRMAREMPDLVARLVGG